MIKSRPPPRLWASRRISRSRPLPRRSRRSSTATAATTGKPWRDVAPPHPDVMSARFVEAEFAADLSTVARGEGADTYRDPREFYRITYMTGGLRKVLRSAFDRLAGKGGDPVIGLQTSFGGGKTHTMLALYHLANAKNPETLPGLADIFKSAGVATLPRHSSPVVFVGTAAGANQPIAIEGARSVKSLWGLIAVKLGSWKAYEKIKASDEARTNPGSEALIPILKEAAPCLILLDEVVAYARNLDGIPYDGFITFIQSLTKAAKRWAMNVAATRYLRWRRWSGACNRRGLPRKAPRPSRLSAAAYSRNWIRTASRRGTKPSRRS